MSLNTTIFGYLAGIFSILAYFPYIIAVISDRNKLDSDPSKSKPKRASWIIWITTSWIILLTMKATASTFTIWQAWAYAIGATATMIIAIFYGEGGWKTSDRICFGTALVGLILWWALHSAWYAFAIALCVDGAGVIPILKARGRGENVTGWLLFFLGSLSNIIGTFGIADWSISPDNPNLADIVYPWGVGIFVTVATFMVCHHHIKLRYTNRPPRHNHP